MKKDVTGRMNRLVDPGEREQTWNVMRTINLPIYTNSENIDPGILKLVIKYWKEIHIPDDIPCLALAVKCHGNYTDVREAQCVNVLLIWNDEVCRTMTLDWFEGPEEDCITPEWYINATPLMDLHAAFKMINEFYKTRQWENPVYSIYSLPSCLGSALKGEISKESRKQWGYERKYSDHSEFVEDLARLFSSIQEIFSYEEMS